MQFDEQKQQDRVALLRRKEEEELVKILSTRYNIPYIDLTTVAINRDALRILPENEARDAGMAPFSMVGKKLSVAVISPRKREVKQVLDDLERKGYKVTVHMASKHSLEKAWESYKELSKAAQTQSGVFNISAHELERLADSISTVPKLKERIDTAMEETTRYRTSRILEILLAGAIAVQASDVHIEPTETNVRVRLRLDGVLHDLTFIDHKTYEFFLSRIKLLSGLKLNIKQDAQDGRFSIRLKEVDIEIRTSVLPGEYGESVVMRVLNPQTLGIPLHDLGMEPELLAKIEREIKKPNGMILTTGPTGSGKTTTLYAFLQQIYNPKIKVITIENPIEYRLDGITQTQVNDEKGYTFLQGLKSALRQDPDVMMVGEIRDGETAETAIHASLTGHLVLSTLHTNNAAGAIPRLIDLGVNPRIISSAVNIVLAQRLVRKLDPEHKKEVPMTPEVRAKIDRVLAPITDRTIDVQRDVMWVPDNQEAGQFIGYKGRIGIFEAIIIDTGVENAMHENPSERNLSEIARQQNILSMAQDGVLKMLRGVTSLEELERVISLDE